MHALKLSWQQRGPRDGAHAFSTIHWRLHYNNQDGKMAGSKEGTVAAADTAEWKPVNVELGVPPREWDRSSISLRVECKLNTTNTTGVHEIFLDDFRLQRVPINPWQCDLAYFPSYNKMQVKVNSYYHKPTADIAILDAKAKVIWRTVAPLRDGILNQYFAVPPLEGSYTLRINSPDGAHTWSYAFERQKFPWEGNTLGITDQVLPPFTPVTVTGNTVRVVLRDYAVNDQGLFSQVTSAGAPLLAAPMRLVANATPLAAGKGAFQEKRDTHATFTSAVQGPAGVAIRNRTTIEYDGCAKVELTLAPQAKPATLDSLVLEIPLRDEAAPLWHVCRDFLRVNIAGYVPEGMGQIWKNSDFNCKSYYGGETPFRGYFLPYIWLGDETRGLSWFADNDKNWGTDPDAKQPYLTLHREGGQLLPKVHLVQVPTVIDAPRTLVFGLMASPAKPMPAEWRAWISGRTDFGWVGAQYFGTRATFNGKYPEGYDFGLLELQRLARRARLFNEPMPDTGAGIAAWMERAVPAEFHLDAKQRLRNLASAFISIGRDRPAHVTSYFEEHNTLVSHKESKTFGWEWTGEPYSWWSGYLQQYAGQLPNDPKQYTHGVPYSAAPSYHDFAVWYAAEFIKRGVGTYFDNTFAQRIRNTVVTDAFQITPDTVQPSAAIWAQREYHKRIWVLHQTTTPKETPGVMMIHMTNAHILPMLSFNQINLDLEWRDECEPFQKKYAPELVRVETMGSHTGNIPTALANTHGSDRNANLHAMCLRTRDGGLLVHEARPAEGFRRYDPFVRVLRDFGYDQPDAQVYNYWQKNAPITTSDDRVKWLLTKRNGKLLLMLCSWIPERRQVGREPDPEDATLAVPERTLADTITIKVDTKALGVTPTGVTDCEYPDGKTLHIPQMHPNQVAEWIKRYYAPGEFDFSYQGDMTWNPTTGALTVPLHGYGIRMLILQ